MRISAVSYTILSLLVVHYSESTTSPIPPFTTYKYSTELQHDVADLWWNVNETSQEIVFELHVNTTGWIALGISPGKYLFHAAETSLSLLSSNSRWNERC